MAKQWVSILGPAFASGYPSDGVDKSFVDFKKQDDANMLGAGEHYTTLAILNGNLARITELAGKVVHGVRMAVTIELTAAAPVRGVPGNNYFIAGGLDAVSMIARIAFFLPGDADIPQEFPGFVINIPAPYVTGGSDSAAGNWAGVAAQWSWDNGSRTRAYLANYVPAGVFAGRTDYWYARGKTNQEFTAPDGLPIGLVLPGGATQTVDAFGGGVGAIVGMLSLAAGNVQFTKLELLVSEKPTWTASAPGLLTVGAPEPQSFVFTAKYPVGDEPLGGLKLRVFSESHHFLLRLPNGAWTHDGVFTTDAAGRITCQVKALSAGLDTVQIRDGGNERNMTYIFAPRLKAQQNIEVAGAPAPPDLPPPPDPPGGGTPRVCTIVPAVAAVPATPPQVLRADIIGWNSGAVSFDPVNGPADLAFSLDALVVGAVVGFTGNTQVTGPADIACGFYFTLDRYGNQQFQFVELGRVVGGIQSIEGETTFRLTQADGIARYYVNGLRQRVARAAVTGTVRVGAALYKSGDSLPADAPPGADGCFWMNLVQAAQDCVGGPGPAQEVDALIVGNYFISARPVGDWVWNSGTPAFAPAAPSAPSGTPTWITGFASVTSGSANSGYPGYSVIDPSDYYFDASLGRFVTNGEISVPTAIYSGASGGPTRETALQTELFSLAAYDTLPSELKYPAWVSSNALYIPTRRANLLTRSALNMAITVDVGVSTTTVTFNGDQSDVTAYSGTRPSGTLTATTGPHEETFFAKHNLPLGFADDGNDAGLPMTTVNVSTRPTSASDDVRFSGYMSVSSGVAEPGLISAYVDGLEFFEDVIDVQFEVPEAGTGVSVPNARLPVWYREYSGEWCLFPSYPSTMDNTTLRSSQWWYRRPGTLVGTLRDADTHAAICTIAIVALEGGGGG